MPVASAAVHWAEQRADGPDTQLEDALAKQPIIALQHLALPAQIVVLPQQCVGAALVVGVSRGVRRRTHGAR